MKNNKYIKRAWFLAISPLCLLIMFGYLIGVYFTDVFRGRFDKDKYFLGLIK